MGTRWYRDGSGTHGLDTARHPKCQVPRDRQQRGERNRPDQRTPAGVGSICGLRDTLDSGLEETDGRCDSADGTSDDGFDGAYESIDVADHGLTTSGSIIGSHKGRDGHAIPGHYPAEIG